jgi:anthranilate phosphoribosyltransferase
MAAASGMGLKPVLARLAQGQIMTEAEAEAAFDVIMSGGASSPQIAGLLMMLRLRGETVPELTGAVRAMLARMVAVEAPSGATFVLAGLGIPIAKHGNRAASSRAGGADVLTALGVNVNVALDRLPAILREAGCAFLFAPRHHAALRHAAEARTELGTRTIFNLLGPLANPARVRRQLTGVFDPVWTRPMAETLGKLGCEKAWLVHGAGLDELTVAGENQVVELSHGILKSFIVTPEDAGLPRAPVEAIAGGDAETNARALTALLLGEPGAYRDTVVLNAAAGLIVAGRAGDLREGAMMAMQGIDDGAAFQALERLRVATAQGVS